MSATVCSPSRTSASSVLSPTPHRAPTGSCCTKATTSSRGTTTMPSGLASPEASFATNLVGATPTEQVMPCSSWMVSRMSWPIRAGLPSRRTDPDTSRKASSSDNGSTTGVMVSKVAITAAEICAVEPVVGVDHGGLRAQPPGPRHRHGRGDPEPAGLVGGRQHHAAVAAAADDDRGADQLGPARAATRTRRRRPCRRAGRCTRCRRAGAPRCARGGRTGAGSRVGWRGRAPLHRAGRGSRSRGDGWPPPRAGAGRRGRPRSRRARRGRGR